MGIGAGTSLIGGLLGSSAAQQAAQQQSQALQKGMNVAGQNLQSAVGAQTGATGQIQGLYSPYTGLGTQGVGTLSSMMNAGPGGLLQPWSSTFQAPTAAQAAATPGYQFQLQQGLNAMQNSAAARGTLLSGGTLKSLNNYAQGVASTNYQQTYNNAFQNYLQNYGQFQQNQANQYQRLMGTSGLGASMTGGLGGFLQSGAQNLGGLYNANTGTMASLLGAQGQAQAAGTVGAANAWQGALGNVGGAANTVGLYNMMNAGGGGGGTPFNWSGLSPTQISGGFGGPTSVATIGESLPTTFA